MELSTHGGHMKADQPNMNVPTLETFPHYTSKMTLCTLQPSDSYLNLPHFSVFVDVDIIVNFFMETNMVYICICCCCRFVGGQKCYMPHLLNQILHKAICLMTFMATGPLNSNVK